MFVKPLIAGLVTVALASAALMMALCSSVAPLETPLAQGPLAPGKQYRRDVYKNVWHANGPNSCYRIHCDNSTLTYHITGGKLKATEEMEGVQGWLQEDRLNTEQGPRQVIRAFQAKTASFAYHEQKLLANSVDMQRYQLAGHELSDQAPDGLSLSGQSDTLVVELGAGGKVRCQADRLRARFPR